MNATELFVESGKSANVFYCEKCRRVAASRDSAERCCRPHRCRICGKEEQAVECRECFNSRERKKEFERFEKAEKVTAWDGWVYVNGLGYQNGYFSSVDELLEYLEDQPEFSRPEYVWTCSERQFVTVDAEDIYERIENDESAYEDFERGSLEGTDELEAALKAFEKANESIVSYHPDYSKALLLDTTQDEP